MRGPKSGLGRLGLLALGAGIISTRFGGEDPLAPAPNGDSFYERAPVGEWLRGGDRISRQLTETSRKTAFVPDMVTCDCPSRLVTEIDIPEVAERTFGPLGGRDRIRERLEEALAEAPAHRRAPGKPPGMGGRTVRRVPGKPPKRAPRHRRRRNA